MLTPHSVWAENESLNAGWINPQSNSLQDLGRTSSAQLLPRFEGFGFRDQTFWGTPRGDRFCGGRGQDSLFGNSGNDWLDGDAGNDHLVGGSGKDRLVGSRGSDRLFGQAGRDMLLGGSGNDILEGGSGKDVLHGGSGNDRLVDANGGDWLTGGTGRDHFWIGDGTQGITQITDFQTGSDRLRFTELGITFGKLTFRDTVTGVVVSYQQRDLVKLQGITSTQLGATSIQVGSATLIGKLQSVLNQTQQNPLFQGATLSVMTPDGSVWSGASGLADAETERPMRSGDRLEIASATKPFIAVTVLQLVEEGKIDLDDSLRQWLPNVAARLENGNRATVRQLLNHTSGIVEYLDAFTTSVFADPSLQGQRWTAQRVLSSYAYGKDSQSQPGRYAYSNTNYVLLGLIVEKATGTSLAQQVRQRILKPLGMTNTFYAPQERVTGGYSPNYINIEGMPIQIDTQANPTLLGAGASGMVSTAADMARFIGALRNGELLLPTRFQQMLQDGKPESDLRYGLGIFSYRQPGVGKITGHNGGLLSNSQMFYLPNGTIVVALKNGFDRSQPQNNQILYIQAFQAIRKVVS